MSIIVRIARMKARSRIRDSLLLVIIAGAVFYAATFWAVAQGNNCEVGAHVIAQFAIRYGEVVVAEEEFLGDEHRKLLLLRNPGTGSWTILAIWAANGMACFVTSGTGSIAPVRT